MFNKKINSEPTKPNRARRTVMALAAATAITGCATSGESAPAAPDAPAATSSPSQSSSAETGNTQLIEQMNQHTEAKALSMAQEMVVKADSPANEISGDWMPGAEDGMQIKQSLHTTQQVDGNLSHVAFQVVVAAESDGMAPPVAAFNTENVLGVELSMYETDAQGNNLSTVVPYVFNLSQSGNPEGSWVATVTDARESAASPEQFSQTFTGEPGVNDPALAFQSLEQLDSKINEAEALMRSAG